MDNIILPWTSVWAILFPLFLGIQLNQVRLKIIRSIKYFKNENLILLESIKERIDVDSDVGKKKKEINKAYDNVKSFIGGQDYTLETNELLSFIRSFSLLISSYYFSLMLTAFYINSNFAYSYIGLYSSVFILFVFILFGHASFFKKVNNTLAIILFPLLGLISILMGYFCNIDFLYIIEKKMMIMPFTKVIPIMATFLPFYLYVLFKHRVGKFNKKQEKTISENKDFKNLKVLNTHIENTKNVPFLDKENINSKIDIVRKEIEAS